MLATPKAWPRLSLKDVQSPKICSLYFTRSSPCPLHISLAREWDIEVMSLLGSLTERIQCLNLGTLQFLALEGYPFPRLERLHLFDDQNNADEITNTGFMLNSDLFPSLRSLGVQELLDTIPWRTPPFVNFVPLQELKVTPIHPLMWTKIAKHCCETLTSFRVNLSYIEGHTPVQEPIIVCFPRLYHLEICYLGSMLPIPWSIHAKTPNLQTYNESITCVWSTGPIHKDTGTVVSLRFLQSINLSLFPSVRQMEPAPGYLLKIAKKLYQDPATCPDLELIVDTELFGDTQILEAKETIASRNALTGRTIRFGPKMQHGVFAYPGIAFHVGYLNLSVAWVLTSYL